MAKTKKYAFGGDVEGGLEEAIMSMKRKPLPSESISDKEKVPRENLIDSAKRGIKSAADEYMRGAKRIGQDLGIAKDENQYEDKARMENFRRGINEERMKQAVKRASAGSEGYKKGGKVSSASSRADGCAQRGKTKGRMV